MSKKKLLAGGFIALIIVEIVTVWWQYHRAIVTVSNRSGQEISAITMTVGPETIELGELSDGATRSIRVHPHGEAGITLVVQTPNRGAIRWTEGYIESKGGYEVSIRIAPDWKISSSTRLHLGLVLLPATMKLVRSIRK